VDHEVQSAGFCCRSGFALSAACNCSANAGTATVRESGGRFPRKLRCAAGRKATNVGCSPNSVGTARGRLFVGQCEFQT
jgi:hypothetical protein